MGMDNSDPILPHCSTGLFHSFSNIEIYPELNTMGKHWILDSNDQKKKLIDN